eukprot:6099277-Alexandrium_andersonii.AAC.1
MKFPSAAARFRTVSHRAKVALIDSWRCRAKACNWVAAAIRVSSSSGVAGLRRCTTQGRTGHR